MFKTLWRYKWRILSCALIAAAVYYYWKYIREPDWHVSAIEDVASIRDTIRDDHPGFVDAENPDFGATLEAAYARASAMAQKVTNAGGYYYATRAMAMPFKDAHLAPQYYRDLPRDKQWPGFFVGLPQGSADEGLVVIHKDGESTPPVGATLVACSGKSPGEMYQERVLPFTFLSWLSAYEPGDWPWILIDSGNPFLENPSACTFMVNGEEVKFALTWSKLDDELLHRILDPIEPRTNNVTQLRFVGDDMAWISIASFFDSGETVSEDLARLIDEIAGKRAKLEAAKILVVDVRGNLGGSSKAGYQVAQAIWGADYISDRLPHFSTTDWRASDHNLERLDSAMLPLRLKFGSDSELFKTVTEIRSGMTAANTAGEPYFVQPHALPPATGAAPLPLPGKIYFLTDQGCVSACLDFADLMMSIEGVTHVGKETAGDTFYLEVATRELPSGIGQLVYPAAVHRGRARAVNASYQPKFKFPGNMSDSDALAKWIAQLE
jgi:hypothetical protein